MTEPERGGAGWAWDGEAAEGSGTPADVVAGGERRIGRRGLLTAGGALLAGGGLWAFLRSGDDGSVPPKPAPAPLPTRVAGPETVWTRQGGGRVAGERLTVRTGVPVLLSGDRLQVLDPATGASQRTLELPPAGPGTRPDALLVTGPNRLYTSSPGHLDCRSLTDSAADRSHPLPDELGKGAVELYGADGRMVYGRVSGPAGRQFGYDLTDRTVRWASREARLWNLLPTPGSLPDGRVAAAEMVEGRYRLLMLDVHGTPAWTVAADENLKWHVADAERIYVPEGPAGLRALLLADGSPRWRLAPAPSEQWRCLPPLAEGGRLYVPRDSGLLTAHTAASGAELWSRQLPFRLDWRSRPLLAGRTLLVPGPAAAGVLALDADTGTELWTFRDSGPGVDVWSLDSDGTHLYAGHDEVLHALPLPGR